MFVLYEMKDLVRIPPDMFHLKLNTALESELNRKLANKVHTVSAVSNIVQNVMNMNRNDVLVL